MPILLHPCYLIPVAGFLVSALHHIGLRALLESRSHACADVHVGQGCGESKLQSTASCAQPSSGAAPPTSSFMALLIDGPLAVRAQALLPRGSSLCGRIGSPPFWLPNVLLTQNFFQ